MQNYRNLLALMGIAGFGISVYLLVRSFKDDAHSQRVEAQLKRLEEKLP